MEFAYSFEYLILEVRGGCYSQVASLSTDQSLEKLLVDENLPNVSCLDSNDGVAKIREKFDLAKQRFLKIPDALEKMPKMNPKGRNFIWFEFGVKYDKFVNVIVFFSCELQVFMLIRTLGWTVYKFMGLTMTTLWLITLLVYKI